MSSMEIDKKARKASPPSHARGIVARANLFMADKYKIRLSSSQKKLFNAWNKAYPSSKFEKRWDVEPFSPREPPNFCKIVLIFDAVLFLLSVKVSIMIATLKGP